MGKGRDVGMHQIYKFEAKLSQGNGEQMISRDVSRLGERLDMARLLSFYYSGPGFYLNVALTVRAKRARARAGRTGQPSSTGARGASRAGERRPLAHERAAEKARRHGGSLYGRCMPHAPFLHTAPPPRPLRFLCQVVCIYVFLYLQVRLLSF